MNGSNGSNGSNELSALLFGLGLTLPACSMTETKPACTWIASPSECIDEGGNDSDPPQLPCITAPDGTTRTLHQCHGDFTASLSFTFLGLSCTETLGSASACQELHEFGIEPYRLTQVMACCDPYGGDSDLDEYLNACAADLAQQVCTSMSLRIEHMLAEGMLAKTAESIAMQKWIATHQSDCYEALWIGNQASEPGEVVGSWSIPNKLAWQALIKDFTISIDSATVTTVSLPEDVDDFLECVGNVHDNTEIF